MLTGHDVPAAGGGDATKERLLAIALQSGIIGQSDHDTQLRVERNRASSTTPAVAVAPTRTQQGERLVMNGAHLWEVQAGGRSRLDHLNLWVQQKRQWTRPSTAPTMRSGPPTKRVARSRYRSGDTSLTGIGLAIPVSRYRSGDTCVRPDRYMTIRCDTSKYTPVRGDTPTIRCDTSEYTPIRGDTREYDAMLQNTHRYMTDT